MSSDKKAEDILENEQVPLQLVGLVSFSILFSISIIA